MKGIHGIGHGLIGLASISIDDEDDFSSGGHGMSPLHIKGRFRGPAGVGGIIRIRLPIRVIDIDGRFRNVGERVAENIEILLNITASKGVDDRDDLPSSIAIGGDQVKAIGRGHLVG